MTTGRRPFLGAAAAMWSIDWGQHLDLYIEDDEDDEDDESDEGTLERENIGDPQEEFIRADAGGSFTAEAYLDEADVRVASYPSQDEMPVALYLEFGADNGGLQASSCLEPHEARRAGEMLIEAAETVEAWRDEHGGEQ